MAGDEWFGRYQLLRRLAFGGMAEIFLAKLRRDEGFEKRVVLKRILPQFSADPSFVQMFIDEAVLAARISHPNVVQVYDFGNVDGVYFIAMEHVDGADLRQVLKSGTPHAQLKAATTAAIGEGVARGLQCAHDLRDDDGTPLSLIHRDVSPHNIMISRAGEAKVMDFGIAKAAARVSSTATGTIKGKVAYMAPEQASGAILDGRCDQFALGLVLWECLSGERMFAGNSDLEVLQKVVHCQIRDLRDFEPEVPGELCDMIMQMLAAKPGDRFANMGDVAAALAAYRFSLGAEGAVDLGELIAELAPAIVAGPKRRTSVLDGNGGTPRDWAADVQSTDTPHPPGTAELQDSCPSGSANNASGPATIGNGEEPSTLAASGWEVGEEEPTGSLEPTVLRRRDSPPLVTDGSLSPVTHDVNDPDRGKGKSTLVRSDLSRRMSWRWLAAGSVLAMIALATIWGFQGTAIWGPQETDVARVVVRSSPSGAQILVDGLATGLVTPAEIPEQTIGAPLRLGLQLGGFEPWKDVVIPTASTHKVDAEMRRMKEAVAVSESVTPNGPTISDGTTSVTTSSADTTSPAGTPDAVAAVNGESTARDDANVYAGSKRAGEKKRTPKSSRAKRKRVGPTGSLSLRSTGAWVDVYLGDQKLGTTPVSRARVPAGVVRLRLLNRVAGIDQVVTFDVPEGEEIKRTVTPRK